MKLHLTSLVFVVIATMLVYTSHGYRTGRLARPVEFDEGVRPPMDGENRHRPHPHKRPMESDEESDGSHERPERPERPTTDGLRPEGPNDGEGKMPEKPAGAAIPRPGDGDTNEAVGRIRERRAGFGRGRPGRPDRRGPGSGVRPTGKPEHGTGRPSFDGERPGHPERPEHGTGMPPIDGERPSRPGRPERPELDSHSEECDDNSDDIDFSRSEESDESKEEDETEVDVGEPRLRRFLGLRGGQRRGDRPHPPRRHRCKPKPSGPPPSGKPPRPSGRPAFPPHEDVPNPTQVADIPE
ncbi:uncharacterized protein LOC144438858 [Glandiceps talaboti]